MLSVSVFVEGVRSVVPALCDELAEQVVLEKIVARVDQRSALGAVKIRDQASSRARFVETSRVQHHRGTQGNTPCTYHGEGRTGP